MTGDTIPKSPRLAAGVKNTAVPFTLIYLATEKKRPVAWLIQISFPFR